MKEGLEANHVKRHCEEMRKMREVMDTNHEKRLREAVANTRAETLNNGSAGGTNDAVPDLSIPSLKSKSFNEKKNGITGIECKDKDREDEKTRRAMREEVVKIVRDYLCTTL